MSNNKSNIEEILDDGELTMEELDRIAGGESRIAVTDLGTSSLPPLNADAQLTVFNTSIQTTPLPIIDPLNIQVSPPVNAKIDSSYTSHLGAIGTSGNEASTHMKVMPINLTATFP